MAVVDALEIVFTQADQWFPQMQRHAILCAIALILSVVIGVPAGAWLTRIERAAFTVISIANLGRTIPSLAVLALVYPLVGTGFAPALIALVALGIPPILLNTYTGIREVDANVADAARGMGLSTRQQLSRVEVPIAAPIVIAGVRTSAVQIVASATLAALIGGGGLGETILAGLTNLRYDLLLAGAFLVAMLALGTELAFTWVERRGLPAGIRMLQQQPAAAAMHGPTYRAGAGVSTRHWRNIGAAAALIAVVLMVGASGASSLIAMVGNDRAGESNGALPTVTIGSKDFTEQLILGELYAQALEAQGYPVERKLNLGATAVADSALKRGAIDVYPEYTGTALYAVLKGRIAPQPAADAPAAAKLAQETEPGEKDTPPDSDAAANQVYDSVALGYAKRGMTLLQQTPFSNGNAILMTRKRAQQLGVQTLSDLGRSSRKLKLAAVPGFDAREDGLPLLKRRYDMRFQSVRSYENGLKYKALVAGTVDAAYGFETDGQIARHHLVVLEDDMAVWPPYHAVPVVNRSFVRKAGAAFMPTVNAVSALLDARSMQRLNNEVDDRKLEPAAVAHDFLKKHGMLVRGPRPKVTIGSKDFTEQLILGELYAQALEARGFPVTRRLNLGATAVADAALRDGSIDLYPEYTGTALTAVLRRRAPQGATAASIYESVRDGYERRQLTALRPTPFSNGNVIAMTEARAHELNVRSLSDLAAVSAKLKLGMVPGFDSREDGLPLLKRKYGMRFKAPKTFEIGLKYKALADGTVDAVYGFETDGQIAEQKLVVLTDDKRVWPAYQATPIVSHTLIKKVGPEFAATINTVSGLLDAKTMRTLNTAVDRKKRDPAEVAQTFLKKHGLVTQEP